MSFPQLCATATATALLGLAACGPSRVGPPASSTARMNELLPEEERRLDAAVAKKRGGDPIGAWQLIADLPASSPARLDDRYNEVMAAYADARTKQIGAEITGGRGGGPARVETTPSAGSPDALSAKAIDRFVNEQRAGLRVQCYGERSAQVTFQLQLRIDPDGHVVDAALVDVRGDASVAQCVRARAESWVFPRSGEGADHRTRFIFSR